MRGGGGLCHWPVPSEFALGYDREFGATRLICQEMLVLDRLCSTVDQGTAPVCHNI